MHAYGLWNRAGVAGGREVAGVEAETVTTTFGCVEKPSFLDRVERETVYPGRGC